MVRTRKGFTLIELLVVIAIIAILAAILFPVFASAKKTAQKSRCAANLKQINAALITYTDDNNGKFPGSPTTYYCKLWAKAHPAPTQVGPYMIDFLHKYIKNGGVWLCPALTPTTRFPKSDLHPQYKPQNFTCTDNGGMDTGVNRNTPSNYMWNYVAHGDKGVMISIAGSSTSLIIRTTKAMTFIEMPYWGEWQPHNADGGKGVNMAMFDGHVQFARRLANIDAFYEYSWRGWWKGAQ